MTRPLKTRPFGDEERNVLDRLSNVVDDPIPHDSEILRKVVEALLKRLRNQNRRKEAAFLASHIRNIAAVEREFSLSHQKRAQIVNRFGEQAVHVADKLIWSMCNETLPVIVAYPFPRGQHACDTLLLQRDWLTAFFRSNPVSAPAQFDEYSDWLKRHRSAVFKKLAAVPCLCDYRPSLAGITKDELLNCTGPAQLIDVILAELHKSSRSAIRKILSHAQPK